MMSAVDDLRAVVETELNPGYEPRKEDIRYFLAMSHDGQLEIEKIVVTNIFKMDNNSPEEQVRGYKYGHPDIGIAITLPYPLFESREALCEHYRKIFE